METFPIEGKISTITLNEKQIQYLEEYLIKEKGITDSKMSKSGSSGIGWNSNSYWYIKDFNKSGKNEYAYFQISKFIESKNEFKKGDYIVQLCKGKYEYLLQNHIYVQSENHMFLDTDLDSTGSGTQSSQVAYKKPETWRYATKQEVEHYNKINKPYDVTTIVSSVLKNTDLKKGIIYYTDDEHDNNYLVKLDTPFFVNLIYKSYANAEFSFSTAYNYYVATPEQIQHYKACLKAGKYVEPNTKIDDYWCIGSYVVALKDEVHCISSFNKGDIAIITGENAITLLSDNSVGWFCEFKNDGKYVKWFATKSEAELFAKTLVEVKSYDYEVVHCTTQEEWDFAALKLGRTTSVPYKSVGDSIELKNANSSVFYDNCKDYKHYKFYTFKEWCDMNNYVFESKPQFIVGRWYDFNKPNFKGKVCAKFLEIDNDYWFFSEYIGDYEHKICNGNWYSTTCTGKLTDLSEIQQYLPDGHVDKINTYVPQVGDWVILVPENYNKSFYKDAAYYCKQYAPATAFQVKEFSSNNIKEDGFIKENGWNFPIDCFRKAQPHEIPVTKPEHQLEVGKYYVTSYGDQGWYIFIATESLQNCTYINIDSKIFIESKGNFTSKNGFKVFQKASKEQIEWLDRCISANEFVPKELTKDELLEIAKSKYPVGTKFIPAHLQPDSVHYCIITNDSEFVMIEDKVLSKVNDDTFIKASSKNFDNYGNTCFNRNIYYNGKWAEIVDKPNTTSFTADFKWESKSSVNIMAQRMAIHGTYGIMNGGNLCNEIELPSWEDACANRIPSSSTTDEILRILNQYMEIEIPDTTEEVVLPQLLKNNNSLINIKF